MQDWMGVTLFGTKESDKNSVWNNIQTVQKLGIVTLDDLLHVRKLSKYDPNWW